MHLRARELTRINRLDEAVPMWEKAIDMAVMSEGPLSLTAITQRLNLALNLSPFSNVQSSQRHFDAAILALRQLGGAHELRAAFAMARYAVRRSMSSNGITVGEALSIIDRSRNVLANSTLPVPPWYVLGLDLMQSTMLLDSGRVIESWRLLEAKEQEWRRSAGESPNRVWIARNLGVSAAYVGKHELADGWLRAWLALQQETGRANHPGTAFIYFLIVENLNMWGHFRDAEIVLDQAPKFGEERGSGTSAVRWPNMMSLALARTRLAAGRIADAIAILRDRAPAAEDPREDWTDYRATLGEALCAAGRYGEGLDLLKQAVAAEEPLLFEHAVVLARRRALIGLCAAGMGNRGLALRYAAQARQDFVAQSEVSPYFKAPLFKLERALGLKLPSV
jgi:tetratricopeptide (TPR) repeat protein